MRSMRPVCTASLALLAACGLPAGAAPAPGAEVFGGAPFQTGPVLSPSGHWLAWIEHKGDQARTVIFDVDARKAQQTLNAPSGKDVTRLVWSDDETLLIGVLSPVSFRFVAQPASGGEGQELLVNAMLVAAHTPKPGTVLMSFGPELLEVDTRTGKSSLLKAGGDHTINWVVDPNGQPMAREDWNWQHNEYRVSRFVATGVQEILRRDDAEPPQLGGVLPGGRELLLLDANGRNHRAAWALPLDGSHPRLLAEEPGSDITGAISDAYSGAVVGVYVSGEENSMHWLDAGAEHRYELLARAFPDRLVQPYSWTQDGSRALARVSAASAPPIYYLTDFKTHHADIAAEEYPALAGVTLAEVKEIHYKARDGTDIPAYLTLPPGASGALPLVVLPHGGPHSRDYAVFDTYVQFLATRGYAVVQPQFRGSSGYGDAWRDAGDRQWGRLMQDDLTDAVHALVAQGIAKPSRVAIVGLSPYAGYAALAGAAFTPEVYACAVSVNGLADLAQVESKAFAHPPNATLISTQQSVLKKQIGGMHDAKRASPINAVAAIRAPLLLIYGANPSVSPDQGHSMASALQNAGKTVTVVDLGQRGLWWQSAPMRIRVLQELEKFLDSHLREVSAGGT